jgi:hypothetical protein
MIPPWNPARPCPAPLHPRLPKTTGRALVASLALSVLLTGCAAVENAAQLVLASRTSATAVVGGRILEGEAAYNQSRSGAVHLHNVDGAPLSCSGELRLTATASGVASLTCSDGQTAVVPFQLMGALRAAGRGMMGETPVALTYGLSPEIAAPFLGVGVEQLVRAEP